MLIGQKLQLSGTVKSSAVSTVHEDRNNSPILQCFVS